MRFCRKSALQYTISISREGLTEGHMKEKKEMKKPQPLCLGCRGPWPIILMLNSYFFYRYPTEVGIFLEGIVDVQKKLRELVLWLKKAVSITCLDRVDMDLPLCLAANELRSVRMWQALGYSAALCLQLVCSNYSTSCY